MSWKNEPIVKIMMVKGEKGDKGDKGDPGSGGGGTIQPLSIYLPDGSSVVYNGSISKAVSIPATANPNPGSVDNNALAPNSLSFDKLTVGDSVVWNIVKSAASYAGLMGETIVNVKQMGAKGDGETDDTTAINMAFDFVRESGGVVFFPAGTYIIGGNYPSRNYCEFYSNTHIIGVPGATVLTYPDNFADNSTTATGIQSLLRNHTELSNRGYDATENVVIEGITFDGRAGMRHKSTHLGIGHAKNIVVRNCVFKNKQSNMTSTHYLEFNAVQNGVIENCSFYPSYHYALDRDAAGAASDEQQRVYGEYINIDVARPGAYGYYNQTTHEGYYYPDGAECDNVDIRNCYFESYPSNHFINYTTQPYIPYAIGGHYADGTHGWFETSKNVHIYNNYFLGDWNVGRINGSSDTIPQRRYTINANYKIGSVDYWSIHDNVFKSINEGSSSSQNKLPCGILLNTTGTHNFIYNNTFINYDAGEIFYHGLGVKTYDSAQTWNNVNIATDGTVTLWANLSATPYVPS